MGVINNYIQLLIRSVMKLPKFITDTSNKILQTGLVLAVVNANHLLCSYIIL